MALDKAIDSAQLDANLTTIADAIRTKGGTSDALVFPAGFVSAVQAIQAGGGGTMPSASSKDVNFYDYDGTLLYSYTLEEAQALTVLPDGPVHAGLVFDGWNYSLESVKSLTRPVNIGAMYSTDDGTTRIYIHLENGRISPMLGICPKGTVTVDWGDGTTPDILTGTSLTTVQWTPTHNYVSSGDYVIKLTVGGEAQLYGSSGSNGYAYILRYGSASDKRNSVYQNSILKVEIGAGIRIGNYAFSNCYSLSSITIPYGVTSIGSNAFYNSYSLSGITIPDGVTSIGNSAFSNCSSLSSITIPDGVTSIGSSAFSYCYGIGYYDFTALSAVPTLSNTSAFTGISADCEIRVPSTLAEEWKAATNWATYADYIVGV